MDEFKCKDHDKFYFSFVERNWLNKKEVVVEESAERDKLLSEIGVKFSNEYFMKRYNLSKHDFSLIKIE